MPAMSGLSGNEMYCLGLKGLVPGELVIGNSVYSLGFLGSIGAGLRNDRRRRGHAGDASDSRGAAASLSRMDEEAAEHRGHGITGVTSDLKNFSRQRRIPRRLAPACTMPIRSARELDFSTSSDGQELYCQLDAGLPPIKFVFGNVAYAIGVGGGIIGGLKSLARGEIKQFSDVFNHTRHLALQRLVNEAKAVSANAVVGIQTTVMPFRGIHEMMMTGTASRHPELPPEYDANPVTSDLTCEEMWNMASMGYLPIKLVLGTAVYSLGIRRRPGGVFQIVFPRRGQRADLVDLRRPRARHRPDPRRGGRHRRGRRDRHQNARARTGRPARIHGDRHGREAVCQPENNLA